MPLRRGEGNKLSEILALLVIFSISFAVLATLLPAASADSADITTNAWVDPYEITIGDTTTVTLEVCNIGNETKEGVYIYYVLPDDVEYVGNATEEPYEIIGNMLLWDIGDLTNDSWTVSFELFPDPDKIDFTDHQTIIPLNMVPYSRAICEGEGHPGIATVGGNIESGNLTFGFVIHEGVNPGDNFEFLDHETGLHIIPAESTIDDCYISGNIATFWGNATINGTSGYQFVVNVEDGEGPKEVDNVLIFIWGPGGFVYSANIIVETGEAQIQRGLSDYVKFPQLYAIINRVEGESNIYADGKYIGQPVNINGYAKLKVNKTGTANVRTKICADGFRIYKKDSTVSSDYPDADNNISVSTIWVPMSSGMHRISISTYVLNYKGEEVWNEDIQGPNEATNNKTIYIRRVR